MRVGVVPIREVSAEGNRLTGGFHLSEDQVAISRVNRFRTKDALETVCGGRGVFRGPIFRRAYVNDPKLGAPYVSGSDLLQADVRPVAYLSLSLGSIIKDLTLHQGMILVTCSGMNLGDVIWTRSDLEGLIATHDLIRVIPDASKIPPGYLYAFMLSRYGHAFIRKQIYGGNIKHVEPEHLGPMPIPRIGEAREREVHELALYSADARSRFVGQIRQATRVLFESIGLEDLQPGDEPKGRAFTVRSSSLRTLRALNHDPEVLRTLEAISSGGARSLGEICAGGQLSKGKRFKRVDADEAPGVRLVGQKHGFWMRPHGRWISSAHAPPDVFASDETVLIASAGTLGRRELYGRPLLATGSWLQNVYTEHFLRIISGDPDFPGAYLYAFLRSELAFRALRSMSSGSKQQEIHRDLVADLPIPAPPEHVRMRVTHQVREAFKVRDEADNAEERALGLVESAIEQDA